MGIPLQLPTLAQMVPHVPSLSTSLLFSLDPEEGSGALDSVSQLQLEAQLALLSENMAFLLRPQSIFQSKLLRDVRTYKERAALEDEDFDVVSLAAWLSNVGYRVHVRTALGGGQGTDCFHNLRHEFLVVQGEGDHGCSTDLIVEPAFQAQFKISHSTPRYDGLLAMIPSDLVTTPAMLSPLVQLLCAEMQLAFEHHGLSLPPWRQSKSMQSKWLPQKSRDFEPSPYGSPRAASPDPHGFPLLGARSTSSGYQSPGVDGGQAPASPRAVLTGASAVLISHASAAHPQQGSQASQGLGLSRAKSLLSDRLAASTAAPQQPAAAAAAAAVAAAAVQHRRELVERSSSQQLAATAVPAAPQQLSQQQQGPPALYRVSAGSGIVYRVATAWQEPPIRTVKMQGPATQRT